MVDLGERQFLAQLVALPAVGRGVDRLRVKERLIQLVHLLLDGTDAPLLFRRAVVGLGSTLLPHMEDSILNEAHVAGCWLQEGQFVHERAFECGLAHVHRSALSLAVVVRVVAVAALRPAGRERPATDFATDESAQWEVRMVPLPRTCDDNATVEHRLRTVERGLIDERIEVALDRDTVVGTLDLPDINWVPHHLADALWR